MLENLNSASWPNALMVLASQTGWPIPCVLLALIAAGAVIGLARGVRVRWSDGSSLEVPGPRSKRRSARRTAHGKRP